MGEPLASFEEGGPDDPKVAFNGLRETLTLVKDELSPYGWRAYNNEFRDRQRADKKLNALNRMPGSGVEPSDGILQGTPLWQERLDKMLLIEHLKKKLMYAHGLFAEASEFMLASHAWLIKDDLLAEMFVKAITHVPPSAHERADILQAKLEEYRTKHQALENELEDIEIARRRNREKHLQRITEHQKRQLARRLCDDVIVAWSYTTERDQVLQLCEARRVLEARVLSQESRAALRTDEHEECLRQWNAEREVLEKERDDYKKRYQKMVRAHEQAMEDLKSSGDTAEGRAKMIQVLSTEKARLSDQVEELEDTKKRLLKQLSEARLEIARQKQEIKKHLEQCRETEGLLLEVRREVERLEGVQQDLEAMLDAPAPVEAALRDDLLVARGEILCWRGRYADLCVDVGAEQRVRCSVEAERDRVLAFARDLEAEIARLIEEHARILAEVKERAAQELRDTLAEITAKHAAETTKLDRRNKMLEREVMIGDEIGPNLPVLNPLPVDDSHVCRICRRAIVFEGPPSKPEDNG